MLRKVSLVFVWLMFSYCLMESVKAVSDNDDQFLIARGYSSEKPEEFGKYMVDVRFYENPGKYGSKHRCAGSIVSKYAVLSVAFCAIEPNTTLKILPLHMQLVAGSTTNFVKGPHARFYKIKQILLHPKYEYSEATSHLYSAAIIRPSVPIEIVKGFIEVVGLPTERALGGKNNCTLIGWGTMFHLGPRVNELLQGEANIVKNTECAERYDYFSSETMLCAGGADSPRPNIDTCQQDAGAPIFCDNLLYGISLFGFACGIGYESVFLDTAAYRSWIVENIGRYPKSFVN